MYIFSRLSQEYRKLRKFYDDILSEKKEYEAQLELLQGTIKEYDTLIANKVRVTRALIVGFGCICTCGRD